MSLAKEFLSGSTGKRRCNIKRLPQCRWEVERWFTLPSREDEAWHTKYGKDVDPNDEDLTIKIFGGYDLLDGADNLDEALGSAAKDTLAGAFSHMAYKDCRLIHEECAPTKKEFQLYQVYQTLTSEWALEDADKPGSTENGLRTLQRVQVARPGTAAPYDEDDVGVETIVETAYASSDGIDYKLINADCSAAGASTYKITGKIRSSSTGVKYCEISGEAVTYNVTVADQWIDFETSTSNSVTPDEVFVGYALFGQVPFEVERFSEADWRDIRLIDTATVETVAYWKLDEKSSGSLDGVTAVDSSGNGYDGTHIGGTGGTDSKTLYLAGFDDDSDDRRGRFITRWAEAGILNRSEDKIGSQKAIVIAAFATVPTTPSGYTLAKTSIGKYEGIRTNDYTFLKPSVLSDTTSTRNNGKLLIRSIEAFNQVPSTPSGFTKIDDRESDVEGVPTRRYTFAKGTGIIRLKKRIGEAGILYYDVVYLSTPSVEEAAATTAALGGLGTALTVTMDEADGHRRWTFSTIDDSAYNGSALVDSADAQRDGAIVYVRSAWNQDPTAPGDESGGYYNTTKKTTLRDGGKKTVMMTWVKVPGSYTEKNVVNFKVPGSVYFSGSRLKFEPGVTRPFVSTVSHTFTNTPASNPTLYEILQWSALDANYVDAEDGKLYFVSEEFPGYLGSGSLASSSEWFGQTVQNAAGTLSSDPATVPTGAQNIDFQSSPYLSSLAGTRVYRNTTVSITLPGGA